MTRRLVALAAGALAVVLISSTFDPADARGRGGGGSGRGYSGGGHARAFSGRAMSAPRFYGGSSYRARSFAAGPVHHRHRHFRRGIVVGVPLAYGAYYYTSGCEWLRRKALYTGSGYWWSRYYACLDGYY
jgi:hypothetical protein